MWRPMYSTVAWPGPGCGARRSPHVGVVTSEGDKIAHEDVSCQVFVSMETCFTIGVTRTVTGMYFPPSLEAELTRGLETPNLPLTRRHICVAMASTSDFKVNGDRSGGYGGCGGREFASHMMSR